MVEAYQDQGKTKDALRTATENTSSFFYPKAKTIGIMFHNLFVSVVLIFVKLLLNSYIKGTAWS